MLTWAKKFFHALSWTAFLDQLEAGVRSWWLGGIIIPLSVGILTCILCANIVEFRGIRRRAFDSVLRMRRHFYLKFPADVDAWRSGIYKCFEEQPLVAREFHMHGYEDSAMAVMLVAHQVTLDMRKIVDSVEEELRGRVDDKDFKFLFDHAVRPRLGKYIGTEYVENCSALLTLRPEALVLWDLPTVYKRLTPVKFAWRRMTRKH